MRGRATVGLALAGWLAVAAVGPVWAVAAPVPSSSVPAGVATGAARPNPVAQAGPSSHATAAAPAAAPAGTSGARSGLGTPGTFSGDATYSSQNAPRNGRSPSAASASGSMPFAGPALDAEQMAIVSQPGGLEVFDNVTVANPHATVLPTLRLPLPAAAAAVRLVTGFPAATRVTGAGILAPLALAAHGRTTLEYTFVVPDSGLPAGLIAHVAFPTAQFVVLVRARQLAVQSGQLADLGVRNVGGLPVREYVAEGLPPGEDVHLTLAAPPGWLQSAAAAVTTPVWMALAAVTLALLVIVGMRRGHVLRDGLLPGDVTEGPGEPLDQAGLP